MENPFYILEQKLNHLTTMVEVLSKKISGEKTADDKPLNITGAAAYLDMAKQTLYTLTSKREIPHLKRGKKLYFMKADLDAWLQQHRKKTRSEIVKGDK